MKKNFIFIMIFICMLFSITGCVKLYDEDISLTYNDYWEYSLGDYKVSYEQQEDSSNSSGGLITYRWYDYTFSFKDTNNDLRSITVSNYDINDFNEQISTAAGRFLREDVEEIFKEQYSLKKDGIKNWSNTSIYCEIKRVNQDINLYDLNNGLKFKELSLNTLAQNNISVEISTYIELEGGINDYPNLKQQLIDDVKFIFEDYQYSNITFEFTIEPSDDWYHTEYYLSYDGINYNWAEKYLGDKNKE